jgi:mRNA interferase MazF
VVTGANPGWAEIWIVDFDGAVGRRPAVVLTRPVAVDRLNRLLVAPATTRIRGLPSEVRIGIDEGLDRDGVLNFDTPELLERTQFVRYIGDFPRERWPEVCAASAAAMNCDG